MTPNMFGEEFILGCANFLPISTRLNFYCHVLDNVRKLKKNVFIKTTE